MNHIDTKRAELQSIYDVSTLVEDSEEVIFSPTRNFRLETACYLVPKTFGNWQITKVTVFHSASNETLFTFLSNDERFFHNWAIKDDHEYLLCAEDIYGGQTIIDLTAREMSGYSPNEDGFISTVYHMSPDGALLLTSGCYWACPYAIKLFDFSNPLVLPWRELRTLDNNEDVLGWINNTSFKTKGMNVERIIHIDVQVEE